MREQEFDRVLDGQDVAGLVEVAVLEGCGVLDLLFVLRHHELFQVHRPRNVKFLSVSI